MPEKKPSWCNGSFIFGKYVISAQPVLNTRMQVFSMITNAILMTYQITGSLYVSPWDMPVKSVMMTLTVDVIIDRNRHCGRCEFSTYCERNQLGYRDTSDIDVVYIADMQAESIILQSIGYGQ